MPWEAWVAIVGVLAVAGGLYFVLRDRAAADERLAEEQAKTVEAKIETTEAKLAADNVRAKIAAKESSDVEALARFRRRLDRR